MKPLEALDKLALKVLADKPKQKVLKRFKGKQTKKSSPGSRV
jgi:hypothetical protein